MKQPRILTLAQLSNIFRYEQATEFLSLASTPIDEVCTQAGDNFADQQIECRTLINQLRRIYGPEPEGSEFIIIENFHDFGIYYEAGIIYQQDEETEEGELITAMKYDLCLIAEASEAYAMKTEHLPELWDEEARAELRAAGHTQYQPAKVIKMKRA